MNYSTSSLFDAIFACWVPRSLQQFRYRISFLFLPSTRVLDNHFARRHPHAAQQCNETRRNRRTDIYGNVHYQKPVKMKLKFYCSAIREIAASMSNYDYQLHSRSRFAAAAAQNKIIIYCSPRKLSCNLSLSLAAGESHHRDDFASFSSLAGKAALLHHSAHRTWTWCD